MTAILGGLGAACCFACTALCAARAARLIGGTATAAWGAVVGLLLVVGPAIASASSAHVSGTTVALMLVAGGLNALGLVGEFRALRDGQVSLVMPVIATEGAVAAVVAGVAGEPLAAAAIAALAVIVLGLLATVTDGGGSGDAPAATEPSSPEAVPSERTSPAPASSAPASSARTSTRRTLGLSAAAALAFGVGIYVQGRVGDRVPILLAVVSAPTMGVLLLAVPLAVRGGLRLPRPAVVPVVGVGLFEVLGFLSYTAGARDSIAVAAVLMSQFGAVSVVLGYVLLGERLGRRSLGGLGAITVGVAALALVR